MDLSQLLLHYLESPAERRAATEAAMKRDPDAAFRAIRSFRGPWPAHTHIVDVYPDYIAPLLTAVIRSCPRLVLDLSPSDMREGEGWNLRQAAIETGDPRLAEFILSGLRDRSPLVKLLIVEAIGEHAFLQLPQTIPQLKRLLTLKSLAPFRDEIESALRAVEGKSGGKERSLPTGHVT